MFESATFAHRGFLFWSEALRPKRGGGTMRISRILFFTTCVDTFGSNLYPG